MRIVVNDIAASTGGAISILKDFYYYIVENDKENEWIFILSDNYIEETENIKVNVRSDVKKNWLNRLYFDLVSGKKYIENLNPDIVLSLQNTIISRLKTPQIVYIHQSIPFQVYKKFSFIKKEERFYAIYQYIIGWIIKRSAKKANYIIVQTKWMKNSIVNQLKINKNKIYVLRPSLPKVNEKNINQKISNTNFFYPADNNIYKNHKCLFEASKILKDKKVREFKISLTLDNDELNNEEDSAINYLGRISREEVLEKLKKEVLVFPSYIETIGLPLLEAIQCKTIIIVADCEYSREVLEGYSNAYYFDPFNSNELAMIMEKVINKEIKFKDDNIKYEKYDDWNKIKKIINYTYNNVK